MDEVATPSASQKLRKILLQPTFLMCAPVHSDAKGEENNPPANDFSGEDFSKDLAMEQWQGFKDKIEELGGRVILVEPGEDQGAQVYTADPAAFHMDIGFNRSKKNPKLRSVRLSGLVSEFTNADRNPEIANHAIATGAFISDLQSSHVSGVEIQAHILKTTFNTEGSGDNVYDPYRGLWWSGYSKDLSNPACGRSDVRAHKTLARLTNREVFSMEVVRPYFHIDTSQTPLPKGHVLSYKPGITAKSFEQMRKRMLQSFDLAEDKYLINVTKKDALNFACNLTAVTETDLIVPDDISDNLAGKLAKAGYRIHALPYTEMRKGGGLCHCTANRVNMIGPKGGTANDPDFYNRIEAALS